MENFELNVNLTERSFTIKGTEDFIDRKTVEIMEIFANINKVGSCNPVSTLQENTNNLISEENSCCANVNHYKKYEDAGIVSLDGEDVLILRQVPGKNNAAKMKNIALISLYVLNKPIEAKSIVCNCEKMSCYDSKNFSSVFKNDKSGNFIRKGKGQNWTLTLTIPGMDSAIEVLEEMYSAAKK